MNTRIADFREDKEDKIRLLLSEMVNSRGDKERLDKLLDNAADLLENTGKATLDRAELLRPSLDDPGEPVNPGLPESRLQRKLFEEALDMIIIADADTGLIVDCNQAALSVTGWSREELIGKPQRILHPPSEHDQGFSKSFRIHTTQDAGMTVEDQVVTKSGHIRDMNVKASLIGEGSRRYLQGVFRDVTQAKQDRERLSELELVVNMSPVVAIVWDQSPGWPIEFVSENCRHLFGYSASDLLKGKIKYIDLIHPLDRERIAEEVSQRTQDPSVSSYTQEYRIIDGSGVVRWLEDRTFVKRDSMGRAVEIQGVVWDISDGKEYQDTLQTMLRHEEALSQCSRELVSQSPQAIRNGLNHLLEATGVSRAYIFKNQEDPVDGLCMRQTHEVCAQGIRSELDNPQLAKLPYNKGFSRWAGMLSNDLSISGLVSEFPESERLILEPQGILSILVIPIKAHGRWWGYVGFDDTRIQRKWSDHDVRLLRTAAEIIGNYIEREQTALLLQESEERFRSMAAMAPQPIFEADASGRLTFASDRAFEMFGYAKADIEDGFNILNIIAEDDRERAIENLGARAKGVYGAPTEYAAIFRDGEIRPVLICSAPIFRSGVFNGTRGVIIDISERRETEKLLSQIEKYRAIADLSAGVAHNFNNMLQIIMGNAELARMKLETVEIPALDQNLREITQICKFASDTVKRLNRFARDNQGEILESNLSSFDLSDTVVKAVDIVEPLLSRQGESTQRSVSIYTNNQKGLIVKAIENDVLEVLVNLLRNAVDAMPDGGRIGIDMWRSGSYGFVAVSDTGIGVDLKDLERIFTPFYTTSTDIGRGLGLPTSRRIAQDLGGDILARSRVGSGSVFTLKLPLTQGEAQSNATESAEETVADSLRILAIDDADSILTILKKGLGRLGHEVVTADSGAVGLQVTETFKPDVIICDIAMPDMDGVQFCRELNKAYSQVADGKPGVFILTGLPESERSDSLLKDLGVLDILSKPVDLNQLALSLNRLSAGRIRPT